MKSDWKEISLEKIQETEGLPIRAINVLSQNGLTDLDKIMNHFQEYFGFDDLSNCGKRTSDQISNICWNYYVKVNYDYDEKQEGNHKYHRFMTLEQLAEKSEIDTRSLNLLKANNFKNLGAICDYFNSHGGFKNLRNCGEKTNELISNICKKYNTQKEEKTSLDADILVNEVLPREEVQNYQLKSIIENLDDRQLIIINSYILLRAKYLSKRTYNLLENIISKNFTISNIYNFFISKCKVNFKSVRNLGRNSIEELLNYIEDIEKRLKVITNSDFKDKIEIEYYNSIIRNYYPDVNLSELSNTYYSDGELKIFSIINQLLDKQQIFNKKELIIFKNTFNYFLDFHPKKIDDITNLIEITRERVRQLKNEIYDKLDTYFEFIKWLKYDNYYVYNINRHQNVILINNDTLDKINREENNKFNKLFINKIFSILFFKTHELIGREKDTVFNKEKRSLYDWKSTYLIQRELTIIFDFEKFIDNVFNRLNSRITCTYSFYFQSYLLNFYYIKNYKAIDEIANVCEKLLLLEFGLVIDIDENIKFHRNTTIQNWEVAKEILEEAYLPLNIKEIYKRLIEKYPTYETTADSLSAAMRANTDFIFFGKTSTYGLKIWEDEFLHIKGGTILDIVEGFLNNQTEPKHILEITEYVCKYRDTNARSIYSNIQTDKTNTFLILNQSFIGLNKKKLNPEYNQFLKIPKFFGNIFKSFIKKNHGISINDTVIHFSNNLEIEERIISNLIKYQIDFKFVKLHNGALTI